MRFVACCFFCGLSIKTQMPEYVPQLKSSYTGVLLRRQTVKDYLEAIAFVEVFKRFDHMYVYEQEGNE